MSVRRVGIAIAAVAVSALAGCSTVGFEYGDGQPPVADVALVSEGRAHVGAPGEVAKVAMRPADAASTGNPERQYGTVVEDQSARPKAYALDTGDRLRIFVYGQPNLSRLYAVDQAGSISVPLIGTVRARGLTTTQLEGSIRARLSQGLVRDPQVTVDVQQNRPFFILGEVRNPGQFPYVTGMTVEMAVAIAGGFGERANERKARLSRRNSTYNDVIDVTPDTEIEPGDTVYIYERFF